MVKYVKKSSARYQGVRADEETAGYRAMVWSVINWVLLAGVLALNMISVVIPLNGRTPGEIADSFHVLFEPAAYAFWIWGLIYLGLLAFAVYQLLPSQWNNPRIRATDGLFAATCLANTGWLFAWHFGTYILSMVAILVLLFALSAIYLFQRGADCRGTTPRWTERLFVLAPFSLYLAWICVSTIANAAALLPWAGFKGLGVSAIGWAVIFSFLTAILSVFMSLRHRELIFPAVVVWALAGEIIRQSRLQEIVVGCVVAIGATLVGAIAGQVFGRQLYATVREPRRVVTEDSSPR
jgi:benzodiazapine receptor